MTHRPTVLYILASSRSGSTLLERTLARVSGTVAAGELVHLWTRGLRDDEACGCGRPFSACPRWQDVGERAFGGWRQLSATRQVALQLAVDRQRHMHRYLRRRPTRNPQVQQYVNQLGALYRGIAAAANAEVIIDSSKHASTALLLRHVPGVQVQLVHLVRDPRGVVSSWSRVSERPEAPGQQMHRLSPTRATLRWAGRNLQGHVAAGLTPSLRVRYEDLVRDPRKVIREIAASLSLSDEGIPSGAGVVLTTDHTVAGNPMRFRTGPLELRLDERWRTELSPSERRAVTLTTWPFRLAYGYTHEETTRGS